MRKPRQIWRKLRHFARATALKRFNIHRLFWVDTVYIIIDNSVFLIFTKTKTFGRELTALNTI